METVWCAIRCVYCHRASICKRFHITSATVDVGLNTLDELAVVHALESHGSRGRRTFQEGDPFWRRFGSR